MTSSEQIDLEHNFPPFSDLNIPAPLKQGIHDLGYVTPTAFQKGVFDNSHLGKNVFGEGNSNYGKSLAFLLPILAKVDLDDPSTQALIISEGPFESEVTAKECRALGRHLGISVGAGASSFNGAQTPQVLILAMEDCSSIDMEKFLPHIKTFFLDDLSTKHAHAAFDLLGAFMTGDKQVFIFGKNALKACEDKAKDMLKDAVLISNNDQPKISLPAKHIYHLVNEALPKPRALLAAMVLHKPKSAVVSCYDAQECELLARYLMRYGFKAKVVSEDRNRHAMTESLEECLRGGIDVVVCQNSLLSGQALENLPFMLNYDMIDRPEVYEQSTKFNKQAKGLERMIVSLATSRELGCLGPIKAQCLIDFSEMPLPPDEEVSAMSAQRIIDMLAQEASSVELAQFEELMDNILKNPAARPALSLLLRNYLLKSSSPEEPRERRPMRDREPERRRPDRREREPRPERQPAHSGPRENTAERPHRASLSNDGITRLYVTLGRKDGFNDLASLAQYLSDEAKVDLGHFSGSGMVRDHSAHIEVDDDVAQNIIDALHNHPRPLANGMADEGDATAAPIICEKARLNTRPPQRPMQRRRPNFQRRS